jgi:hypothetical protein
MRTGGIFQQWLPGGDDATQSAVARSLQNSFPYVRVFQYGDNPGRHFLASLQPIPKYTPSELARRMPARAVADFVEWGPYESPDKQFSLVAPFEVTLDSLVALAPNTPPLQDDRPINEYYFLRTPCTTCNTAIEFARQRLYRQLVKSFHMASL